MYYSFKCDDKNKEYFEYQLGELNKNSNFALERTAQILRELTDNLQKSKSNLRVSDNGDLLFSVEGGYVKIGSLFSEEGLGINLDAEAILSLGKENTLDIFGAIFGKSVDSESEKFLD